MIFTTSDLEILARTGFGEARGQDFKGQLAVAWVVRNRAARPQRFSQTIAGVCLAPVQFSCWNRSDPTFVRMVTVTLPDPAYATALAAAATVLTDHALDPTGGADHYCATSIPTPPWARLMHRTVQIGDHVFYKE
jgi:N-acetylmuramoyl-L-alanine amidase